MIEQLLKEKRKKYNEEMLEWQAAMKEYEKKTREIKLKFLAKGILTSGSEATKKLDSFSTVQGGRPQTAPSPFLIQPASPQITPPLLQLQNLNRKNASNSSAINLKNVTAAAAKQHKGHQKSLSMVPLGSPLNATTASSGGASGETSSHHLTTSASLSSLLSPASASSSSPLLQPPKKPIFKVRLSEEKVKELVMEGFRRTKEYRRRVRKMVEDRKLPKDKEMQVFQKLEEDYHAKIQRAKEFVERFFIETKLGDIVSYWRRAATHFTNLAVEEDEAMLDRVIEMSGLPRSASAVLNFYAGGTATGSGNNNTK